MFYAINKAGKIMAYNDELFQKEGCEVIQKNFSQEDLKKIEDGLYYVNGRFVDSPESMEREKKRMITRYKEILKEIREMSWDLEDLKKRLDIMSDEHKSFTNARISVLEKRIEDARTDSDSVAILGIEKYGEGIIAEL